MDGFADITSNILGLGSFTLTPGNENKSITFDGVPVGAVLHITETSTGEGELNTDNYSTSAMATGVTLSENSTPRDYSLTVADTDEEITVTFTNTRKQQNVSIIKTDATGNSLTGAKSELYKAEDDDTPFIESTEVNDHGILSLGSLPVGTYHLVETQAPAGYIPITSAITIIVAADGVTAKQGETSIDVQKDNDTWTIPVQNTAGVQLPSTGGPGTALCTAAGLSLILGASLWLMLRRRKEQQN